MVRFLRHSLQLIFLRLSICIDTYGKVRRLHNIRVVRLLAIMEELAANLIVKGFGKSDLLNLVRLCTMNTRLPQLTLC